MRDIKFRAWDGIRMISGEDIFIEINGGRVIADNYKSYEGQCGVIGFEDCIKDVTKEMTLQQFTGLHDKNGKEIFEGDILRDYEGDFSVEWNIHEGMWSVSTAKDNLCDLLSTWSEDAEVIGNIYENPDLISN